MTYGELFRQVAAEVEGKPVDETHCKYADTVAPSKINQEVPPEMVDMVRQICIMEATRINKMDLEEVKREVIKYLSQN